MGTLNLVGATVYSETDDGAAVAPAPGSFIELEGSTDLIITEGSDNVVTE